MPVFAAKTVNDFSCPDRSSMLDVPNRSSFDLICLCGLRLGMQVCKDMETYPGASND